MDSKQKDYLQASYAGEHAQEKIFASMQHSSGSAKIRALCELHRTTCFNSEIHAHVDHLSWRKNLQTEIAALGKRFVDQVRTDKDGKILRDLYIIDHLRLSSWTLLEMIAKDRETKKLAQKAQQTCQDLIYKIEELWPEGAIDSNKTVDYVNDMHEMEKDFFVMLTTLMTTLKDPRLIDHLHKEREQTKTAIEDIGEFAEGLHMRKKLQAAIFAAGKSVINLIRTDKGGKNARDLITACSIKVAGYELLMRTTDDPKLKAFCKTRIAQDRKLLQWGFVHMDEFLAEDNL